MPPGPEPPTRLNPTVRDFVLRLAIVFGVLFAVGLLSGPNDRPHRATFADFLVAGERGDRRPRCLPRTVPSLQEPSWKTGWPSASPAARRSRSCSIR